MNLVYLPRNEDFICQLHDESKGNKCLLTGSWKNRCAELSGFQLVHWKDIHVKCIDPPEYQFGSFITIRNGFQFVDSPQWISTGSSTQIGCFNKANFIISMFSSFDERFRAYIKKYIQCKTDRKCAISKFENNTCSILDDEFPQLLKAGGIYPGNLLVRIDLIFQYVKRMDLDEPFQLSSLDNRLLVIDRSSIDPSVHNLPRFDCILEAPTFKTDIIPRHILDRMRYDS